MGSLECSSAEKQFLTTKESDKSQSWFKKKQIYLISLHEFCVNMVEIGLLFLEKKKLISHQCIFYQLLTPFLKKECAPLKI